MALFAPIAPPHLYPELLEKKVLGNYRLYLAHEVVEQPNFHRQSQGTEAHVILDNGTVELGKPVDLSVVEEAVKICQPRVIVLPDVLGNYKETVKLSVYHLFDYQEIALSMYNRAELMIVPQGNTLSEHLRCAIKLLGLTEATWIGIPRRVANTLGSRMPLALALHELFKDTRIHLLGCSDNLLDDIACSKLPFITGIDSSLPILLAGKERSIASHLIGAVERPSREEVVWEKLQYNSWMSRNIETLRQLIG